MKRTHRLLLIIDAIINLLLGLVLLLFPVGAADFLGLPATNTNFYPTILGGVIFGIGIALVLELIRNPGTRGLGLEGAIAINFCGGLVLLFWLLFGKLNLPLRGLLSLWILAGLVLGIGLFEVSVRFLNPEGLPDH